MWLYLEKAAGEISQQLFNSFDEAFETCSKNMEEDFNGHYVYHKETLKKLIEKHHYISYNFGWYESTYQGIVDMSDTSEQRFYPHKFNIMEDYKDGN